MSTLKKTIKQYPMEYEKGKIYYHKVNAQFMEIWKNNPCMVIPQEFELTKFLTESQRFYLDKRKTWAWLKTYLPKDFCLKILEETELKDIIEHYALCYHDKDNAKSHTHILIKFYRNESYLTKLFEWFHCDNISDCRHKLKHCYDYLIHNSKQCRKDRKYLYDEEERVVDDIDFWQNLKDEDDDKDDIAISIVHDILNGVPQFELLKRYGREFVIYRKQYYDCAINCDLDDKHRKGMVYTNEVDDEF